MPFVEFKKFSGNLKYTYSLRILIGNVNHIARGKEIPRHLLLLFTTSWSHLNFYAFPPFNLITKVLQKIRNDKTVGTLVVPVEPVNCGSQYL